MTAKEADQLTLNSYEVLLTGINEHIKNRAERCERVLRHSYKKESITLDTLTQLTDILRDHGYDVVRSDLDYKTYTLTISW